MLVHWPTPDSEIRVWAVAGVIVLLGNWAMAGVMCYWARHLPLSTWSINGYWQTVRATWQNAGGYPWWTSIPSSGVGLLLATSCYGIYFFKLETHFKCRHNHAISFCALLTIQTIKGQRQFQVLLAKHFSFLLLPILEWKTCLPGGLCEKCGGHFPQ